MSMAHNDFDEPMEWSHDIKIIWTCHLLLCNEELL